MTNKPSEFTKNLTRLETIAKQIEKEEVDLEESLGLYEEAAVLVKKLKTRLAVIENKIEEVRTGLSEDQESNPELLDSEESS